LSEIRVDLPAVVGRGYGGFWRFRGRYLVCKGSRGSKKSTTAALKMIYEIMRVPGMHGLVIRRYNSLNALSTFAQLQWAISRLHVEHLWRVLHSPMQLVYTPTGQTIQFRGLDDPLSITSITVPSGAICLVWIEEAYQIMREEDFNKLDLSVRGTAPAGAYKQFILTFNPWEASHWLKARFFDPPATPSVLAMTTDYTCNEWLTEDDRAIFEDMRVRFPRRYQVEGLGDWGHATGLVYTDWRVEEFDWQSVYSQMDGPEHRYTARFGIDFGFSTDPTAFIALLASQKDRRIYIFDEYYAYHATNQDIADHLTRHGYSRQRITADSAEPRTINELVTLGIRNMRGARKGPDSIRAGIQRLQDYEIIVHPRCKETENELSNFAWELDKSGRPTSRPAADGYDHLMDALRYATEDLSASRFEW